MHALLGRRRPRDRARNAHLRAAVERLSSYASLEEISLNVTSKCGLTPQYEALEALYKKYRERGFEVLAFTANELGAQEPSASRRTSRRTRAIVTAAIERELAVSR